MHRKPPPTHLGVGLYGPREASRIIGVPPAKVQRWLRDGRLLHRYFDTDEQTITFVELMELHFISMFRQAGVSLQTIRQVAKGAAERFETDYPFSAKRFDTDGRTIFATLIKSNHDGQLVEDLKSGQYIFDQVMRPFFRKLEYHGDEEVARFWPLEKRGRVVLDPERHFGKPIDSATGVPTHTLYAATIAGGGQDYTEVARWFDVPVSAVEAAVAYEKSLAA
jgi:hypothetical protein